MNPTTIELTTEPIHLAIETTGRLGSLAVFKGATVLHHVNLSPSARTAATLTPELHAMLKWTGQAGHSLEFVSVADGPGSFTGLRIGVTSAKTLCYALSLPLVAVDSLAAVAAAAFDSNDKVDRLIVALNAYRGQAFAGTFQRNCLLPAIESIPSDWFQQNRRSGIVPANEVLALAREFSGPDVFFAGDSRALGDADAQAARDLDVRVTARSCDAVGVGMLGLRAALTANFIDPLKLIPRYLKPSAAEEKATARQ